jgi:maltooligosyltrehalose trehalohydrolase
MKGERLSSLVSFEALKVAAGMVLLSGGIPLLFMGEEYGEDAPFFYFMSFQDRELIEAVREGRKKEFAEFKWRGEPEDPYDKKTFSRSKLHWDKINSGHNGVMLEFYKALIKTRNLIDTGMDAKDSFDAGVSEENKIITITRKREQTAFNFVVNFNREKALHRPAEFSGRWKRTLVSSAEEWSGPGTDVPEEIINNAEFTMEPLSFAVFEREK